MLMTSALVKIVEALRVVDADSKQLRNLYSVLNESLTNIERNLTTICHSGTTTYCTPPDLTSAISDPNQVNAFSLPLHFFSNCISLILYVTFSFVFRSFKFSFVVLSIGMEVLFCNKQHSSITCSKVDMLPPSFGTMYPILVYFPFVSGL